MTNVGTLAVTLAVTVLATTFCPAVGATPNAAALQTLERYSRAVNAGDCEAMLDLTSPAVLAKDPERFRDTLCHGIAEWHADGLRESLTGIRGERHDGARRLVVATNLRTMVDEHFEKLTRGEYVLHSEDAGRTWKVIDLTCVSSDWVQAVYPAYRGHPAVHGADMTLRALPRKTP